MRGLETLLHRGMAATVTKGKIQGLKYSLGLSGKIECFQPPGRVASMFSSRDHQLRVLTGKCSHLLKAVMLGTRIPAVEWYFLGFTAQFCSL